MKQYTKKYGQVFLKDRNIRDLEVRILNPEDGDRVLEIGPGTGFLTEQLLKYPIHLTCVESDHRFAEILNVKFREFVENGHLEIVKEDFLNYDPGKVARVIGNIPYQISSPVLERLALLDFKAAVIMVQKEFAMRMVSGPNNKQYSRLSVFTYINFDAKVEKVVSRNCFFPKPDVDSAIVSLFRRDRTRNIPDKFIDSQLKMLFSNRRKKIGNIIKSGIFENLRVDQLDPEKIMDIIEITYQNYRSASC